MLPKPSQTLLLTTFLLSLGLPGFAAASETQVSRSISYETSNTADATQRTAQLQQATPVMVDAPSSESRVETGIKALHIAGSSYNPDFSIYDVSTVLISDLDDDGFYHRFSLRIDADTAFDRATVYARLYLSYEGGPWSWYATSANYRINGDSSLDSFTIETELADGFAAGYYDVRVELYDADYGDFLLAYGPYDDASLRALPLEDSYHDENTGASIDIGVSVDLPLETEIVVTGTGATGSWLLAPLMILMIARRFSCRVS